MTPQKSVFARIILCELFDERLDTQFTASVAGFVSTVIGGCLLWSAVVLNFTNAAPQEMVMMLASGAGFLAGGAWQLGWPRRAANMLLMLVVYASIAQIGMQ